MPANMMIEPAGSSLKVMGRSSATVSAGPMPGSTPTAVPRSTPMSATSKFIGWTATASPCARETKVSMVPPSDKTPERTDGQGQGEKLSETQLGRDSEHEADQKVEPKG